MKKIALIFMSLLLSISMTACGQSGKTVSSDLPSATPSESKTEEKKAAEPMFGNEWAEKMNIPDAMNTYPLEGNPKVTWFFPQDGFISIGCKDFNAHEVMIELQKQTGVEIEFVQPPVGEFDTRFSLMASSNDWTDIVTWADAYKGGLTTGIDDGVFLELNDIAAENSPNYEYFRTADEDRRKSTVNDQGQLLAYYNLAPYPESMWLGLMIKQEALDKTKLTIPETIDEWTAFFEACKNVGYSGAYTILNCQSMQPWTGSFNGAYDSWEWTFLNKDGKVDFGPIQPGTKEWLAQFRKWMEAGYIDKEFVSRDFSNLMAYAQSDKCAVTTESPDTMWGVWKGDMGIDFVGAPNAVLKKGDKPQTVYKSFQNAGWATTITTQAKSPEVCAKLLDYGYSRQGYELTSFGIEGKTHKLEEKTGKPFFFPESPMWSKTDDVPIGNRVWKYKLHQGPFISDQHNSNPSMVAEGTYSPDIRFKWEEEHDHSKALPALTLLPEQLTREAEIGTYLTTLRNETFTKIVFGELPVDAFDDFVSKVKANGYDEWIKMWQDAYDRYTAR